MHNARMGRLEYEILTTASALGHPLLSSYICRFCQEDARAYRKRTFDLEGDLKSGDLWGADAQHDKRWQKMTVWWFQNTYTFYFHPYLGKIPMLTNISQWGWNHQLVMDDYLWVRFTMFRVDVDFCPFGKSWRFVGNSQWNVGRLDWHHRGRSLKEQLSRKNVSITWRWNVRGSLNC